MKRLFALTLLFLIPLSLAAQKVSHIRIVRISLVSGTAEMNQQDGTGWHKALLNAPITERTELRTGPDGRAVVEFEDASLLQLPPSSQVDFTNLSLANGVRQNVVTLARGTAFFSLHKHDSDAFVARFPGGFATLPNDKAWFRIDLGGARLASDRSESAVAEQASVRVLNGKVEVQSPDQVYILKKDDQLTLRASAPAELVKVKALDGLDQWSQQLDTEAEVRGHRPHDAPGYGLAELSSYGSWAGGYWYPNVAAGWSPYNNGNWFWDPMMGYTWVSSYPWGWLPYHYGTWMMSPGGQWYWAPGSNWNFAPQPIVTGGGSSLAQSRPPLPMPPVHRRVVTAPQPQTRISTMARTNVRTNVRTNESVRAGLRMPPVNVRRVILPPAALRQSMNMALNPAQRAALTRASQSRQQVILQQEWRMQSRPGFNRAAMSARGAETNRQSVNSPRIDTPVTSPRVTPMPRMESMPRVESVPRMGGSRTPH